jgi:hypothetical protein
MSAYAYAHEHTYNRVHSIIFMTGNLLLTLRELIRENGLSPDKLVQDWKTVERGVDTWLRSGHLNAIVIEFYKPGSSQASARWDIPISYNGSGVDDDMWLDKAYLRQLISKSARPSWDCTYRVMLCKDQGAPPVAGFVDCSFLSTGQLVARPAGTVIATAHLTAGVTYWR